MGESGRGGEKARQSSRERRTRGSKESLTDSQNYEEGAETPGIKTKIFHALGLNS